MARFLTQHGRFDALMRFRVREVLLVSSPYDYFTLEEDGRINETILLEYKQLSLSYAPRITHVTTAEEALQALNERHYDLVITMSRVGEMLVHVFGNKAKEIQEDIPVVLLAYNTRELALFKKSQGIDLVFVWSGNSQIFLAIIKIVEDSRNVEEDTSMADVPVILLVEDSRRFYSLFLPQLYQELMEQTGNLAGEGLSLHHKVLRRRARAKILLATDMEQAQYFYKQYSKHIIGLITDAAYPWKGKHNSSAGSELIKIVKQDNLDVPIIMQSSLPENRKIAEELNADFLDKSDSGLLKGIRTFMREKMGFGDFVFRDSEGSEVGRAKDIEEMIDLLPYIDSNSLKYHGERHDFSRWFRARTEFDLAKALRPKKVGDFEDMEEARTFLLTMMRDFQRQNQRGEVADFSLKVLDIGRDFLRIGGGSLGGKGRSLAFFHSLLSSSDISSEFPDVKISVPPCAVIGTSVFDEFMTNEQVSSIAYSDTSQIDDNDIATEFLKIDLPDSIYEDVKSFSDRIEYPVAIRSSSLLEDSQHQPFAGVYETYMLSNNHPDPKIRLQNICDSIKLVYASVFYKNSKSYIASTPNSIEEEKMAVVIQQVEGQKHGDAFYPTFSGVARSRNFYPLGDALPEEGVVAVALGLGKAVVEGEKVFRFSPSHPEQQFQFATTEDYLRSSQREFWAVDMSKTETVLGTQSAKNLSHLDLSKAEMDRQLHPIGSVYSPENDAIYDGLSRRGVRLVTFAGVTKHEQFPLSGIINFFLGVAEEGFSGPVEIEFAVTIDPLSKSRRFSFLQARPLVWEPIDIEIDIGSQVGKVMCRSDSALGNGLIEDIRDVLYIHPHDFVRGETEDIVEKLEELNKKLISSGNPYLLIGPGRWGSTDKWLGIPVRWAQISGASTIIECEMSDYPVEASQGTHFFQNIVSFGVGYLTSDSSDIKWDILDKQEKKGEYGPIKHVRFSKPLHVMLDGQTSKAAVIVAD